MEKVISNHPILITEVVGRSEQGMTLPFLCSCENESLHYLKGGYAGYESLCHEWVGSNLARLLEIPIPDFAIAEVPDQLIQASAREDIRDLGAGLAFASKRLEGAREITWREAGDVPDQVKASVLLFDWWVLNEDRCLSSLGGNPNLLVTAENNGGSKLWMFDFNLAFDFDFSRARFLENHLFAKLLDKWPAGFRDEMEPKLASALQRVDDLLDSLPDEWLYPDGDDSLPAHLNVDFVRAALERAIAESDKFWNLL